MKLNPDSYHFEMIYSELEYVVGEKNITTKLSDKITYSCDYYWIPEMWLDRGCKN